MISLILVTCMFGKVLWGERRCWRLREMRGFLKLNVFSEHLWPHESKQNSKVTSLLHLTRSDNSFPTHSSLSQNVPEFIPGFIPACIPACCDCMAFIEGLLLFCKCPNSGANSESSAVDPLALLVWFPADNPAEGYRGEEPTGFIPNDPDIVGFILDNPVTPEFIPDVDNPVIPVFILDMPV